MEAPVPKPLAPLALVALGSVFAILGSSPLYALQAVLAATGESATLPPQTVLGLLSLCVWSLLLVVGLRYGVFFMRAQHQGEGGIVALTALALQKGMSHSPEQRFLLVLGLTGMAMVLCSGALVPALAVQAAVAGLVVASPTLTPAVLPVTLAVLVGFFAFQHRGTARISPFFGPLMALWFAVLALLGLGGIVARPEVLQALNPLEGLGLLWDAPALGFSALGAMVLCTAGAEALHAARGRHAPATLRLTGLGLCLPALVIHFFGQGALLLADPGAGQHPFYRLAPDWSLYPLMMLALLVALLAAQGAINGVFVMARQAIHLGYAPRQESQPTGPDDTAPPYLPAISGLLLAGSISLVLEFDTLTQLAAAYAMTLALGLLVTTLLAMAIAVRQWGWHPIQAFLGALPFLLLDMAYGLGNLPRLADGAWLPLAVALVVVLLLTTWMQGRQLLGYRLANESMSLASFVENIVASGVDRVPGTAVFMTPDPEAVPHAMLHSLKHYRVLHEQVLVLSVRFEDIPRIPEEGRLSIVTLPGNFYEVTVRYGFQDEPDIPAALALCTLRGIKLETMETSFFLGRETLIPKLGSDMPYWRELLFVALFRNAGSATAFFKIPSNRVVELGSQVVL